MNTAYVTDGSFEGLLSAVYDSWYRKEDEVLDILPGMPAQPDFLVTYRQVVTNEAKAEKVFDAIRRDGNRRAAESEPAKALHAEAVLEAFGGEAGREIARYGAIVRGREVLVERAGGGFRLSARTEIPVKHASGRFQLCARDVLAMHAGGS